MVAYMVARRKFVVNSFKLAFALLLEIPLRGTQANGVALPHWYIILPYYGCFEAKQLVLIICHARAPSRNDRSSVSSDPAIEQLCL
jgi:hypothetical protein